MMITNLVLRLQAFLERQVKRSERFINRLPARTLWIGSAIFTAALSAVLVALLVAAWKRPASYLSIKPVHVPAYVIEPRPAPAPGPPQALLQHLQHLVEQLDSLHAHPNSPLYDSLIRQHPGLRDSLIEAENLFLHPYTIQP